MISSPYYIEIIQIIYTLHCVHRYIYKYIVHGIEEEYWVYWHKY